MGKDKEKRKAEGVSNFRGVSAPISEDDEMLRELIHNFLSREPVHRNVQSRHPFRPAPPATRRRRNVQQQATRLPASDRQPATAPGRGFLI